MTFKNAAAQLPHGELLTRDGAKGPDLQ
jgi:hypothetical protein